MKNTLADYQAAAVREASMPRQKGPNPFVGRATSPNSMPAGMGSTLSRAPMGMATRPPVYKNKQRGTMASHTYSQIPNSMSGMGQSGFAAQGTPSQIPMGGIPQPQGSFAGPAGVGPKAYGPKRIV